MNLARNALLLMILLTTGCMALVAGGVAAVGTYTYVSGQLNRTYNANLERTYNASNLDYHSINELKSFIKKIKQQGKTIVIAKHKLFRSRSE